MRTHTPAWIRRRGMTLTPVGELFYIAGAAALGIVWMLVMIVAVTALVSVTGGAQ